MRRLLADHDIAGVYRLLHRHGVSQRTIAARTGQSQSEISEIVARHRQVHSYELLVRIAEGLGVPRGWMGLAYDETTQPYITLDGGS
jgi:transcriptional regulator with XRE-family HTH domain